MKAIICPKYGPPEVLKLAEIKKPVPKKNEILIKIQATSVTVGDARVRGFDIPKSYRIPARLMMGIRKPKHPVLGSIVAGEIEALGENADLYRIGDRVFGTIGHEYGAYAQFVTTKSGGGMGIIPDKFSYEEAAAIPWGGGTSYHFLNQAKVQKGQKILIYGASGSLGIYAVQIAKHLGAEVTGVCSTKNLEFVKSYGADHVIDYTKTDFTKNEVKYDLIYDAVGKSQIKNSIQCLENEGTYIHAVATPDVTSKVRRALKHTQKKFIGGTLKPDTKLMSALIDLLKKEVLRPVIDRTYPMEEIVEAHRYVDTGRKRGDVIITINHD